MDVAAASIAHDEEERRRDHEEEHEDHHGGQHAGAGGAAPPPSAPAGGGVGEPLLRGRHRLCRGASADPDPDPIRSAGGGRGLAGGRGACASLPWESGEWCEEARKPGTQRKAPDAGRRREVPRGLWF